MATFTLGLVIAGHGSCDWGYGIYRGLGQQPHIQQPGGGCRCHCLLVGGVDQMDSVFSKLWGWSDIPGTPLSTTEEEVCSRSREQDLCGHIQTVPALQSAGVSTGWEELP